MRDSVLEIIHWIHQCQASVSNNLALGMQHLHERVVSIHFLKALNLLGNEILIDVEVLCVVHS